MTVTDFYFLYYLYISKRYYSLNRSIKTKLKNVRSQIFKETTQYNNQLQKTQSFKKGPLKWTQRGLRNRTRY